MKKRIMEIKKIQAFELYLRSEERSAATIEKYMRDVRYFAAFAGAAEITKQTVLEYKRKLGTAYAVSSANSMIAALNSFLRFCGWPDLCIKQFKIQRQVYCSEEKELTRGEYLRLLRMASAQHNERLNSADSTTGATAQKTTSELIGVEQFTQTKVYYYN